MTKLAYDITARGRKYAAQSTENTRARQLAAAFLQVAKVNHYMVGIVAPYTADELDAGPNKHSSRTATPTTTGIRLRNSP